jgi:O-succinylbenzoate synthase
VIEAIEILRGEIALRSPFRTSFGVERSRGLLYVRVMGAGAEGWGECVAMRAPSYSSEFVDGCEAVIRRFLLPLIDPNTRAESFVDRARGVRGHPMAKAALEAALLDYWLRIDGVSLADRLGATRDRVPAGVSVGIQPDVAGLLAVVSGYLDEGYLRIKLKIEPGHDVEAVRAVRREFGDDVLLQVDANAAYRVSDADHLARLDEFGLLLIEQPLAEDDLVGHADLARRIDTPVCLDESITSVEVARGALDIGACSIINIKPGRVGGYLESVAIHDLCVERRVPVWCGGMLETGIGRAANLALAALPGFTLPGDTSASDRYFEFDVTEPFILDDGHVAVPSGPGIGREPLPAMLDSVVHSRKSIEWP